MSWDIYVYAEVRHKDSSEWSPLFDRCVCDNFKCYNDEFIDKLPRMSASNSSHPAVKSLADNGFNGEFNVNYCSLNDLKDHYFNIIDKFNTHIEAVYSALGVGNLYSADYEDSYDEPRYDNKSNPWVKYMTFPVNKSMFSDLTERIDKYAMALQVIGMCDTLSSMCENYDDEVRLTFAIL